MDIARSVKHSTGSDTWYTPEMYMKPVREMLGIIDFDPASDIEANRYVKANRIFTEADNGILKDWNALTVYCNPPGKVKVPKGATKIDKIVYKLKNKYRGQTVWQDKMFAEYRANHFQEGIMLMFNASPIDTYWWHYAVNNASAICFYLGRMKFHPPEGKYEDKSKNSPVHGNGWIYFGNNVKRFHDVFSEYGTVISKECGITTGIKWK